MSIKISISQYSIETIIHKIDKRNRSEIERKNREIVTIKF
jgi:hypothetical protein